VVKAAKKFKRTALFSFLTAGAVSCATVSNMARRVTLVEARLAQVEDITGQPGAPNNCMLGGDVCLDGAYRQTFRTGKVVTGPPVPEQLSVTYTMARPVVGLDYLLVVERTKAGPEIAWTGLKRFGLCLDPDEAKWFDLVEEQKRHPCQS
jgi:hypothetical protein